MNHTDRVRKYLRLRSTMGGQHPEIVTSLGAKHEIVNLTVADLDALCRDSERLHELDGDI